MIAQRSTQTGSARSIVFLTYAKSHGDVWFARKDEIARWALAQRQYTPIVHRGPPSESGLP